MTFLARLSVPSSLLILAHAITPLSAAANVPRFGDHDVESVFFISKSENRNQVHYGIHLDERCRPAGDDPVVAYWREWERGQNVRSSLLAMEERAYGLSPRQVVRAHDEGGSVQIALRALPERPIQIRIRAEGGRCRASAHSLIDGRRAVLVRAHVELAFLGVGHIEIYGQRRDGTEVAERVEP